MKRSHILYFGLMTVLLTLLFPVALQAEKAAADENLPVNQGFEWNLPQPENTPEGEKSPAVTYRIVHETVYSAGTLYVRSGPGSRYPIIGRLSKGEVVRRGAIGNNGWSQILYQDQEAYVNSTYLSVTPILPETEHSQTKYQAADDILYAYMVTKLRSSPSPDGAVVGHLTVGTGTHRVAVGENGWSRVEFHDTEVYACTGALSPQRPGPWPTDWVEYNDAHETVYAASDIGIFKKPSFLSKALGSLHRGDSITRTGMGINGWSTVQYNGQEAYIATAYLTMEPVGPAPEIKSSNAELPTPLSPFSYQYIAPTNVMPYALFTPIYEDLTKPLPLILSLHGALEIGEAPETLRSNFITKEIRNWEYTGLKGFPAYVVCPQMTGAGYNTTWRSPQSADNFFKLLDHLKKTLHIDETRIILEGHSLGGQGALYMAADPRACFSAVVPISAYSPDVSCKQITSAVRGYTGSPYLPAPREDWESYNFMKSIFTDVFGIQNFHMKNCSHYDIPMVAFEEDLDGNGQSDLIEWMLAQ